MKRNITYLSFGFWKALSNAKPSTFVFAKNGQKTKELAFCALQSGVLSAPFCASRSAQSKALATGVQYFFIDDS